MQGCGSQTGVFGSRSCHWFWILSDPDPDPQNWAVSLMNSVQTFCMTNLFGVLYRHQAVQKELNIVKDLENT